MRGHRQIQAFLILPQDPGLDDWSNLVRPNGLVEVVWLSNWSRLAPRLRLGLELESLTQEVFEAAWKSLHLQNQSVYQPYQEFGWGSAEHRPEPHFC